MNQQSLLEVEGVAIQRPPEQFESVRIKRSPEAGGWVIHFDTKAGGFYLAKLSAPKEPLVFRSMDTVLARLQALGVHPAYITVELRG